MPLSPVGFLLAQPCFLSTRVASGSGSQTQDHLRCHQDMREAMAQRVHSALLRNTPGILRCPPGGPGRLDAVSASPRGPGCRRISLSGRLRAPGSSAPLPC